MSFYDELLEENDELVSEFLDEHLFTERFVALSIDADPDVPVDAPWIKTPLAAPAGMRNFINVHDTTATRVSTRTTCHLVVSTLNEALKAITADVSNIYNCMETELMGSDLLVDAQVLEIVKPRTKESPHDCVSLKHVKYRSVLEEYQAEDFLMLETTGKGAAAVAEGGFQYAFRMLRSIEIPGSDEQLESDDVRLEFHRGWVHNFFLLFTETKCPGVLRMDVWLDADVTQSREHFYGGFSGLHDAFSLAIRYRHLVENFISQSGPTVKPRSGSSGSTSVPATAALHFPASLVVAAQGRDRVCQMCTKKVGFFVRKRKHTCAICGIFLCSPCVTSTEFNSWKLCSLCCDRNESLIARHTVSRLASSSFAKFSYMAKVKMGFDKHRQSLYGGERSAMLNRRATVTSARKNSGATRMSFIHKTSGKTAYDVIAEGYGNDGYEGRGSLFDGSSRPTASMSLSRSTDSYTGAGAGAGPYHSNSSASGYMNKKASGLSDGRPPPPPPPSHPPQPQYKQQQPTGLPTSSAANDYYLGNINRSYSISKSRIQLLNDDQQSRLSARTTWRSSTQSDFAEIHSIPETESSGVSLRSR
ncbi:hypothetical protein Gpo141_00006005 [Globisporangium polare]